MAHPKKRSSKSRRAKRRTHVKLSSPVLVICPITGVPHKPHHAFFYEDKMYYRGKVVIDQKDITV